MRAKDFEDKFYSVEGIVIVLRCDPAQEVANYEYIRAASGDATLAELRQGRLAILDVPYVIHNGDVVEPHGKTRLSSIRDSYNR